MHQHDAFIGELTVQEQLEFQAELRMPNAVTREERAARVESVLDELGLRKCQHTQIGKCCCPARFSQFTCVFTGVF
jgi:ABC-type multidrug transport system ATPase subunit